MTCDAPFAWKVIVHGIAGAQRTTIMVQHLDDDRSLAAILHGGTVETEMVPQERRAVGVTAELVVWQQFALLVAFGGRNHAAADLDQAALRCIVEHEIGE